MNDKDRNLIAELEKRLCWYRDEATPEEFDAEEVDAICTMLQKLSPIEEPHMTSEEAFENIMKRVREEEGKEPERDDAKSADETHEERNRGRKRILFPGKRYRAAILFIVVFGAAIFSLNMATYAREDKSLFTMILERVGLLKIEKDGEIEEGIVGSDDEIKTFYDSWAELDSRLKSKIVIPEYIPNGYILYGIKYYNLINRDKVKADYYSKENEHLIIEITLWEEEDRDYREVAIDENVYGLLSEYSDGNTLYYQYENEYICMVSVKNGFYRISGNIALEEMIKVRDGLGDIE